MMGSSVRPSLEINIWSDIACPWCYVGHKRLQQALHIVQPKDAPVKITWHPYVIDPATQRSGEEYMAYNQRRWGSDGWTHSLRRSGEACGATFANWQTWPNTVQAHRLALLAQKNGKGNEAAEALFRACYEEGRNVSDTTVLEEIGNQLGLPWMDVFVNSEANLPEVQQSDLDAKSKKNIHGVPYFELALSDSKCPIVLKGAQSAAAFQQALKTLLTGTGLAGADGKDSQPSA